MIALVKGETLTGKYPEAGRRLPHREGVFMKRRPFFSGAGGENFWDKSTKNCYGGRHYRRSHVEYALTGSSMQNARMLKVIPPCEESIDHHFGISEECSVGDTVVMAFRFQIMADHGNDPNIGHSKHTRECVPILIYQKGVHGVKVGRRKTLSDVGAIVCECLGAPAPQNGSSMWRADLSVGNKKPFIKGGNACRKSICELK